MKKWLSVVAIVVLCLALSIGVACGEGEDEEGVKEVKFGNALPLSGIYGAVVGLPAMHAWELINEKIGEFTVAGETYRWKGIFEDNAWTGAGGVATATKLIFDDGVKMMHQSGADAAGAAQTICEESGVLMDISAAPLELLGPDKPHSFSLSPTYFVHTAPLFKYVSETYPEVERVVVAATDNAFGHSYGEPAIEAAEYFGYDVVGVEWLPLGTTEFLPVATKVMGMDPDFIVCDVLLLKTVRELGYEGRAAYISWHPSWIEHVTTEFGEGYIIYQPNPSGEDLHQAAKEFFVEIEDRYGDEPMQGPYFTAIIHTVLTEALKKAGTVDDIDTIIHTLQTETFDTWLGPMHFAGEELLGVNNMLLWPADIHEIRNGEYTLVYEMSADEAYELTVEVFK